MAILVDQAIWPWRDRLWCHMVSDANLAELHAFASMLGVPERGFQGDHYDIPDTVREVALSRGAKAVTSREIVEALYSVGLRPRPGRQRWANRSSNERDLHECVVEER
jgi:hypothetical protein